MFKILKDILFNRVISLRAALNTIFIGFFIVTIFAFLLIFHFNIAGIAMRAELSLLQKSSQLALQKLNDYLSQVEMASRLSADMMSENVIMVGAHFVANNPVEIPILSQPVLSTPESESNRYDVMRYTMKLLQHLKLAQGVYFGDESGSFIHAMRENNGSITTMIMNRHASPPVYLTIYRDVAGKEIKRTQDQDTYDPRTRPWYQLAKNKMKMVWTHEYLFGGTQPVLGITAATPVYLENKTLRGVFGVDIPLRALSDYVSMQTIGRVGQVFILTEQGKIIAAKELIDEEKKLGNLQTLLSVHEVNIPLLSRSYDYYTQNNQPAVRFGFEDKHYLATFLPIPLLLDDRWLLGVVDRESDVKNQLFNIGIEYILIEIFVIFIGLIFISKIAKLVSTPIKKLVKETEKIKNFDLDQKQFVKSRIAEVFALSKALDGMRAGLRSFKKYVPAALVRQLISKGEDVHLGGSKKFIALMFTDIENFTSISEKESPDELMQQLCVYFDVLTQTIASEHGTVDKFIGDAIMAFWGAPLLDQHACLHAARAALSFSEKLTPLNQAWAREGKSIFTTRMGLHFGEAIVGNVGSTERLNYTALGDAVNLASRLEGVNKVYSTGILISAEVKENLSPDFLIRFVDEVQLRGRKEVTHLYELLGDSTHPLTFDLATYQALFLSGFKSYQASKWEEAISHFESCLNVFKNDTLAPVFIKRCTVFSLDAPANWQGVWHF